MRNELKQADQEQTERDKKWDATFQRLADEWNEEEKKHRSR